MIKMKARKWVCSLLSFVTSAMLPLWHRGRWCIVNICARKKGKWKRPRRRWLINCLRIAIFYYFRNKFIAFHNFMSVFNIIECFYKYFNDQSANKFVRFECIRFFFVRLLQRLWSHKVLTNIVDKITASKLFFFIAQKIQKSNKIAHWILINIKKMKINFKLFLEIIE